MKPNEYLTISRASRRAGLDARLLRQAVRDGDLPAIKPGRRALYVIWSDVERWLASTRLANKDWR